MQEPIQPGAPAVRVRLPLFDVADTTDTVGAPFFAHSAKGGRYERMHNAT